MSNIGGIIGTPVYGYLSDKVGRKPTIFVIAAISLTSGVLSIVISSFTAFVIMRAITGSILPALYQLPVIMLLEIVGPELRTKMNSLANIGWTIGLCILPLMAWLCRDWVVFGLVTSSSSLLFFSYLKFLHESPRWLLSQGRYEEASVVMHRIAMTNERPAKQEDILNMLQEVVNDDMKEKNSAENVSYADLIRNPNTRMNFAIITTSWVASCLSYYGLQYNFPNLDGNEFLNFFLLSVVEFPAAMLAWYLMVRWGRRWTSVTIYILTGLVLLAPIFHERSGVPASVIGKFGSFASFMVIYQQASELYPTPLRAIGMGLSGTIASIITFAVPYVMYLGEYRKYLPFMIISAVCILAGCATSFLPETLNEILPQTINDAESFGRNQRFFSCKTRKRPTCYNRSSAVPFIEHASKGAVEF